MNIKHTIVVRGEIIDLSVPRVMGIINITPDSFFAGSRHNRINEVLAVAGQMLLEGADFLDIGGYSSRPGADDIPLLEEMGRVVEPIKAISKEFPEAIISVDTFRSEVAKEAILEGATIVNDISAGHLDKKMFETVASLKVPYVAMHMRGTPQATSKLTNYHNLIKDIIKYFSFVIEKCNEFGIKDVVVDPGFGFAKTTDQNFELLKHLHHLQWLEKPLLVGLSRKSMIYKTLNATAEEALNGTTALNTLALFKGASILRVHDIKEAVEVVKLVNYLV